MSTCVAGVLSAPFFGPAVAEPGAHSAGGGVVAKQAPTLNTHDHWRGADTGPFGRPQMSTFGQVITVPPDETDLVRFQFYLHSGAGEGRLIVRAEVYPWKGQIALAPAVWEGAPRRIALTAGDAWQRVSFRVGGAELQPGAEYVLFLSISKDYERSTDGYTLRLADVRGTSHEGGRYVFLDNGTMQSQWTRWHWGEAKANRDLAFKAWLRPHV
jgi:hypothetical protein